MLKLPVIRNSLEVDTDEIESESLLETGWKTQNAEISH